MFAELQRCLRKLIHGPDPLLCAMLHFPFVDEFDTALSQILAGGDRERLKITNTLLDACIRDFEPRLRSDLGCSMGVQMGTSGFFVVVSQLPDFEAEGEDRSTHQRKIRKAMFIGRARTFDELDALMKQHRVLSCVISPQPEPHLVEGWLRRPHHGSVMRAVYTNDGLRTPHWDRDTRTVTVDKTYALNAAYEEIRGGLWWLPLGAAEIDGGEFYAQLKAPTRVRDTTSDEVRYRWTESGSMDHYRHAHAFDHLAATRYSPVRVVVVG